MSAQNSPENKAARRAAREQKPTTVSATRLTVCRVCSKRRETNTQGICLKCLDAFHAVGHILASEASDATVIPETIGTRSDVREVGS